MTITKEELMAALRDPDIVKEIKGGKSVKAIKELELTDDEMLDPKALVRALNAKIAEINAHVKESIDSSIESVRIESRKEKESASQNEVKRFIQAHPLAQEKEIIDIMGPLYAAGKSLDEAFKAALKVTGRSEKQEEPTDSPVKPEKKPVEKKPTSLRTMHNKEENPEIEALETPVETVEDAVEAAFNELPSDVQDMLKGDD